MGIPTDRKVMNEFNLQPFNYYTLRGLVKEALSKGKTSLTWSDYGNDLLGNQISGIIGGEGTSEVDKAYPMTAMGVLKLGVMTMVDPKVDLALTIGQASLSVDKDGNVILTDEYDAQKFIYGSRSKGAYGAARNFLGKEGRLTTEGGKGKTIKWRINLGKLS